MKTKKLGTYGRVHDVHDVLVGFPAVVVERTACGEDYRAPTNYLDAKRAPCPACAEANAVDAKVRALRDAPETPLMDELRSLRAIVADVKALAQRHGFVPPARE